MNNYTFVLIDISKSLKEIAEQLKQMNELTNKIMER